MPVGTMAHEFICAIGGMFGPQMATIWLWKHGVELIEVLWELTFTIPLGGIVFSYNFSEDFANQFKGLRIDSGDNFEQLEKIIAKYKSFGIDARDKQVLFSNALDTDKAIEIQRYAENRVKPSFGIGTHFTNDFPHVKPMNIVIKLVAVKDYGVVAVL